MLIDKLGEFSDSQAVVGNNAVVSTNIVDTSIVEGGVRQFGPGTPLWVVVVVDKVSSTNPKLTVKIQTSVYQNGGVLSGTPVNIVTSHEAAVSQGDKIVLGLPYSNDKFIGLQYTGANSPNINVSAHLTDQEPVSWTSYPNADA